METTTETIEILNDLIRINNDRIAGYEHSMKELKKSDEDLKALFLAMIDESRQARMTLGTEVQAMGGTMEDGTMASGKIYRAWMDIKAIFTGHDRHTVLANCEAGEDAAQRAYRIALQEEELPAYLQEILLEQQQVLKDSHDYIKELRNSVRSSL